MTSRRLQQMGAAILALAGSAASGQTTAPEESAVAVPSGMEVRLYETLTDDFGGGPILRFRFLAPMIGSTMAHDPDALVTDMQFLCQDYAMSHLGSDAAPPAQIVISLMEAPVEFGQPRPDVRQIFEAFSLRDDTCIWEAF
ncbi:DUF6497 family protein [Salipiger marinus]|uniref:Acetolactate synthase n=1 Tax=Salipiger marinus TaxID=555512 RepID=A0A1G8RGS6_9RHOB|nr:hypothetical protein SAMN04487993_102021 [Salipiger marinus]